MKTYILTIEPERKRQRQLPKVIARGEAETAGEFYNEHLPQMIAAVQGFDCGRASVKQVGGTDSLVSTIYPEDEISINSKSGSHELVAEREFKPKFLDGGIVVSPDILSGDCEITLPDGRKIKGKVAPVPGNPDSRSVTMTEEVAAGAQLKPAIEIHSNIDDQMGPAMESIAEELKKYFRNSSKTSLPYMGEALRRAMKAHDELSDANKAADDAFRQAFPGIPPHGALDGYLRQAGVNPNDKPEIGPCRYVLGDRHCAVEPEKVRDLRCCDKTIETCRDVFNNAERFGGPTYWGRVVTEQWPRHAKQVVRMDPLAPQD